MARIYSPDSTGKERARLCKTIVLALRELMKQTEPDGVTKDLTAYVILALEQIARNIDVSVEAWEKRGYWVKADKFRLEWEWAGSSAEKLRVALKKEDWGSVAVMLPLSPRNWARSQYLSVTTWVLPGLELSNNYSGIKKPLPFLNGSGFLC